MMAYRSRKLVVAGLGLASTLFLGVIGCGGKGGDSSDSVVYAEPGATVPTTSGAAAAPTGGGAHPTAQPAATGSTPSAPVKAEGWGTLKGQVVFGGNPPAAETLVDKGKAEKDPTVCAKDAPIKSERLVVNGEGKGVKNVLVYIPKPTAVNEEAKSAASAANVAFDQAKCVFEPHVLAVMTNGKINLKSSDPVNHNVHLNACTNQPFNILLPANGELTKKLVAEKRAMPLTCDIHPWMKANVMVFDHPFFVVTAEDGSFEIKGVPAGAQNLVVWQEAVGYVTPGFARGMTVEVAAGKVTDVGEIKLDPAKVKN